MDVIPAIDVRRGRVVRLHQGDYDRETAYAADPAAVAEGFARDGARIIHVVDLDGAAEGALRALGAIEAIVRAVPRVAVQVGGGLRSDRAIADAFDAGAARVVLGTAAVRDPVLVERALAAHSAERVAVGLDARDGALALAAWREQTDASAADTMAQLAALGVGRFIFTDIARDGALTAPNFEAVEAMAQQARALPVAGDWRGGARLIASGGVASAEHLHRLARTGVEAAIVGSAIYEGRVNLADAIRQLHQGAP